LPWLIACPWASTRGGGATAENDRTPGSLISEIGFLGEDQGRFKIFQIYSKDSAERLP
jgi:hypothetical protein